MRVKLEDIVEGMEMQSDDNRSFLNLDTGEIVHVSQEALLIAEDSEDYEHLSEWQQDEVKIALDIVESFGKYAALPSQFDIYEYDMMESFCYSLSDVKMQDVLLNSIRGKGAFRRFKDNIHRLGMTYTWDDYRDLEYKEIAKGFCERKGIDYII
ncbi:MULTISPECIES: UPF0158 family protein [unclassified Bacillus (in: firmicutes)]|jgi:hypothetical protein|nr:MULTISPECIES: UPF0158 family protein [unclassified Bacillus (in: firmicutes)]MCF2650698.1 hypothetical protein [Niallia circulans]REB76436.1 hypothetical protein CP883_07430 [Cutibacterium acnes]